ncbi:hypothetical protein JL721_13153 [Aureococcus anophagefferens]|nr:hypothetical protein JL721_13153 [Aureococcus anophagefferens]
MGSLALAMLLVARVRPQAMGDGVSKYTLPCNAPEAPMRWMETYMPVITSSDLRGRADDWLGLYGDRGFGLHLVNTSFKLTTGGLSVAAVEAVFEERLNDMAHFDAYMDYASRGYGIQLDLTGAYSLSTCSDDDWDWDDVDEYHFACELAGRGYVRIPWVEKEAPYSSKSAS